MTPGLWHIVVRCCAFVSTAVACVACSAAPTTAPLALGPLSIGQSRDAAVALLGAGANGVDGTSGDPAKIYAAAGQTLAIVFHGNRVQRIVFFRRQQNRSMLGYPYVVRPTRGAFHRAPPAQLDLATLTWLGETGDRDFTPPPSAPAGWTTATSPEHTTIYATPDGAASVSLQSDSRANVLALASTGALTP